MLGALPIERHPRYHHHKYRSEVHSCLLTRLS